MPLVFLSVLDKRRGSNRVGFLTVFLMLLMLVLVTLGLRSHDNMAVLRFGSSRGGKPGLSDPNDLRRWKPPKGRRIVALVFYGRKENVSILDCYLKVCESDVLQGFLADSVSLCRETSNAMVASLMRLFFLSRPTTQQTSSTLIVF